jgi:hypothetical protein
VLIGLLSTTNLSTSLPLREVIVSRLPPQHVRHLCKTRFKSETAWSNPFLYGEKTKKKVLQPLSQFLEGAQARRSMSALRMIADESLFGAARAAMLEMIDLRIDVEHRDIVSVSQQVASRDDLEVVSSSRAKGCEENCKMSGFSHANGVISSCRAVEVLRVKYGFASGAVMEDKESFICMAAAVNAINHSSPSSFSRQCSSAETPVIAFGGTGALGLITVKHAVQLQGYTASLVSRTGRCPSVGELTSVYPPVRLLAADVATSSAFKNVFKFGMLDMPQAISLLANGVLRDATVETTSHGIAREVVVAKCLVADHMGPAITATALNTTILFSSVASFLGSAGQIAYSAANSHLDCFATSWTDAGVPSCALQWGPWSGIGMASKDISIQNRLRRIGIDAISPQEGASICVTMLQSICRGSFAMVSMSKICIARIDWVKYAQAMPQCRGDVNSFLECLSLMHLGTKGEKLNDDLSLSSLDAGFEASILPEAYSGSDGKLASCASLSKQLATAEFIQRVCSCIGAIIGREIDPSEPFLAAGLDSLSMTDACAEISRTFCVELPVTVLFDNPTALALASQLENLLAPKEFSPKAYQDGPNVTHDCLDFNHSIEVAMCGFASAGGGKVDSVGPCERSGAIPQTRWDVEVEREQLFLPSGFGAYLPTPDLFDTDFFGCSAAEAVWADPQQRLILDVVSALDVNRLFYASARGVYVGIASRDYDLIDRKSVV